MSQPNKFMRYASPNERRTISREDVGFYNALVIAGVYEFVSEDRDVTSAETFFAPLKCCIQEHPYLSVIVKDKHTEKPYYEGVATLDLHNHIHIYHEEMTSTDEENKVFEKLLPPILDRPWPADIPPWRIVVLPLPSPFGSKVTRCLIAFAFSHTIGDGMVGIAFHRTFLQALQNGTATTVKASSLMTPPSRTLAPPFDTPERLPISWGFLLAPIIAVYLPKFMANLLGLRAAASTIDAGTWTGSPMFFNPDNTNNSQIKILEIEASFVQKILQLSRRNDAKLTATLHQLIVRALSKTIFNRDITNFVSGTAVDMRSSVGIPSYTWGLFVSGHYEIHPRVDDVEKPALSEQMWTTASSITKRLAECATRLQDQAIGLLRYAPSIRKWTLGKVGGQRDSSYEVSNLLAFHGGCGGGGHECEISKMIFTQPGNVLSAPLVFNVISVKGGSLICTISWQKGALNVPAAEETVLVDRICSSIRMDLNELQG